MLVKVPTKDTNLTIDASATFLTTDTASGVTAITVKNITGFAVNQILVIGPIGNENSEIVKTHASTPPSGTTVTLASATLYPHSASTPVTVILYDQIEVSTAATATGSKSVLATVSVAADYPLTVYNDTSNSAGFYFARYKNSITSAFSPYSSPIPVSGYTPLSARSVIDTALGEINKDGKVQVLTDQFFFQQLNLFQDEVKAELKRWSWLQIFDFSLGSMAQGTYRVPVPANQDDQNTNKSVYNVRVGLQPNLVWVDKARWNDLLQNVAHATLKNNVNVSDATVTLTDSNNFPTAGTVTVGVNSYPYTANNVSTGVLTLTSVSTTTNTAGSDVFSGASSGQPLYWTTFGGFFYVYPIVGSSFAGNELISDYYSTLTTIAADTDQLVVPDPSCASYYLQWKALRRLNNGEDTPGSISCMTQFVTRREKLKQKEVTGRTFVLKPRFSNWQKQEAYSDELPREIRDANFPNTDF